MGIFDIFKSKRADGAVTLEELISGNTEMTVKLALQVPAVAWCVNMIASAAAMLPVKLYHKKGDEVEEITDDPRVKFLNGDTGDTMNADNMRRRWVYDYLLRGSAFGYIIQKFGTPDRIIYLPENVVSVLKDDNDYIRKRFSYMVNGEEILPYRMLKILRNSDGFGKGVGIVEESPLILETMYQLLKFQKNQVLKGGNKRGFLKTDQRVGEDVLKNIKQNWSNLNSNDSKETVMFLNGNIDFTEMSASSVEMQVNENVKTNDTEIMRLFGTLDGILSEDTVKNAVMPVLDAFEAAFDSDLLLEKEKADHYFAFDTKELTRGNMGQRMAAYGAALQNNIMQLDEVRAAEDLPPLGFNYIKLGLQDVLLNPKTGEVYTPNTNATANMNALGNIGGDNKNVPSEDEDRANSHYDDYIQDPDTGRMNGRKGHGGSGNVSEKGLDKSEESGIMELYRKGSTHRKLSENGSQIIDKATYHKIVNPAIKSGADVRIADEEWEQHLREQNATAVTIGDIIIFRRDATVSDVLEEVHHFYQNKRGLNSEYGDIQRTILNEIDAKKFLLTQTKKYHIPVEEVELTTSQLQSYTKQMEDMMQRGEW